MNLSSKIQSKSDETTKGDSPSDFYQVRLFNSHLIENERVSIGSLSKVDNSDYYAVYPLVGTQIINITSDPANARFGSSSWGANSSDISITITDYYGRRITEYTELTQTDVYTTSLKITPTSQHWPSYYIRVSNKTDKDISYAATVSAYPPPVIAITSDKSSLKHGESARVDFTLAAESLDFSKDDVTVRGGVIEKFTGSGKNYSAIFTPYASSFTSDASISVKNRTFSNYLGQFNQDELDDNNTLLIGVDSYIALEQQWQKNALGILPESQQVKEFHAISNGQHDSLYILWERIESFRDDYTYLLEYKTEYVITSLSDSGIATTVATLDWIVTGTQLFMDTGPDDTINIAFASNSTIADVVVARYSSGGDEIWSRALVSNAHNFSVIDIQSGNDGAIYVAGLIQGKGSFDNQKYFGSTDAFITKYDGDGNKIWTRILGSDKQEEIVGIALDAVGNIYLAGKTWGELDGQSIFPYYQRSFIAKYGNNGEKLWAAPLGHGDFNISDFDVASDGSIIIAGGGGAEGFVEKYSPDGDKVWRRTVDTTSTIDTSKISYFSIDDVVITTNGEIVLSGFAQGTVLGGQVFENYSSRFLMSLSLDGVWNWTRLPEYERAWWTDLIAAKDGSVYFPYIPENVSSLEDDVLVVSKWTNNRITITGTVSNWSELRPISAVELLVEQLGATDNTSAFATADSFGKWSFGSLDFDDLGVRVQKAVTAKDVDAISASDVLAALKIVHGRDPNPDPDGIGPGNRREISQYQYHSADFNHDGIVNETDVHGILKTAISSSSMQPDSIKWKFFDSSFSTIGISRSNVPDVPMLRPGDLTSPIQLIGVLLGDVDGSWGAQP